MEFIFNSKTGEIFERFFNEPLVHFHVPLKDRPKSNCKKCFGRLYTSKNSAGTFMLCPSCVRRCLDSDKYPMNGSSTRLQSSFDHLSKIGR